LQVRVGWSRVEVELVLLDVLAVVALAVGQAEEPLLEDRVLAVPQGDGEAEELLIVRDYCEPVLAPAVRPRARVAVAEVVQGVAGPRRARMGAAIDRARPRCDHLRSCGLPDAAPDSEEYHALRLVEWRTSLRPHSSPATNVSRVHPRRQPMSWFSSSLVRR